MKRVKFLSGSESLVEFQKENPNVNIVSITPVLHSQTKSKKFGEEINFFEYKLYVQYEDNQ